MHAFHDPADLFRILFRKQPESMRIIRSIKYVGFELNGPGTKDHRFARLFIFLKYKLWVLHYYPWHT